MAIGRNGHAAQIISLGKHFNNRLRQKVLRYKNKKRVESFTKRELDNLRLWLRMYEKAYDSISFNLIVFRQRTKIYLSDACPYVIGEFWVTSRRAWRLKLPPELVGLVLNNVLEFIAEIIYNWLDILEGQITKYDYYLSLDNNISAISWLHKSNFCDESQTAHEEAARHIVNLCIEVDICLYL